LIIFGWVGSVSEWEVSWEENNHTITITITNQAETASQTTTNKSSE